MKASLALIFASCVLASYSSARPAPRLMSEDNRITVVVLQSLVKDHSYLGTPFVCVLGHELPADVFRELQGSVSVPIQSCSASRPDAVGTVKGVKGERGVVLNVSSINRSFGNSVVVKAGYHCANLCAAEYEYQMGRSPLGEWRIAKQTMLWIS